MDYDDFKLIGMLALGCAALFVLAGLVIGAVRYRQAITANYFDAQVRCASVYAYGAERARVNGCRL